MKNIDNFFLPADNFEESKKFYSKTLEMPIKFDFSNQGMIAFKIGDEEPAIILKDKTKFDNAKPCIWIEVENVKEFYKNLKAKGIQFLSEPFKIKTGWAVEFFDPSGNLLGFTDYLND
jgi:predicted enzyme related to lactoylglutathione lyase